MASFAQERIVLDEQIRFSNKTIIYNNFVAIQVIEGFLSIDRLPEPETKQHFVASPRFAS